ncbi:MAG: glycoside hydrolase family 1 protein [Candidatus Berkelbacteria bacterium]
MNKLKFPKNFLFGSATSAHQIEGHLYNDWARWEKTPGHISDGTTSETGADSWNKWREDIQLLKNTSQNAYRFSVEWSRIEPKEGVFDKDAILHYDQIINELAKNNITPMVTLFHFTCPLWLDDIGGVTNRKFTQYFARFAGRMAKEFGDKVELWSVINEPSVYVNAGYIIGHWYPGKRNVIGGVKAFFHLVSAHKQAYTSMKKANPRVKVGIAMNMTAFEPVKNTWCNLTLTRIAKWLVNEYSINLVHKNLDFLGINHYMSHKIQCKKPIMFDEGGVKSEYGWSVHPRGLYQVIMEAKHWNLPMYITENGTADSSDKLRQTFIPNFLEKCSEAIADGADLRGYFHWSLIDNFEWASGYSMKFGLHTIDRKPRKSAEIYKKIIDSSK